MFLLSTGILQTVSKTDRLSEVKNLNFLFTGIYLRYLKKKLPHTKFLVHCSCSVSQE